MELFCDPDFAQLLALHQLNDFDALWNLGDQVVEDPNVRRGGWNGVSHLRLSDGNGITHTFYLKRQQNHLIHCGALLQKKPTFYSDLLSIFFCLERNLPCMKATYYGERKHPTTGMGIKKRNYQAILITQAPVNYLPFSEVSSRWDTLAEYDRHRYLKEIARLFAGLHKNRLSGSRLSTKHLFINLDAKQPLTLIEIDRMGFQFRQTRKNMAELATFVRRAGVFSASEVEFFLCQYCQHHPVASPLEIVKKALFPCHPAKKKRKRC